MVSAHRSMAAYAAEAKSALHGRWRQLLYMALLLAIWYLFSYAFNASLKDWFRATGDLEEGEHTMLPVLLTVFFSNTVAASVWVLQLTGCLSSPMHAVRGLSYLSHAVCRSLCLDLCLMCAAGAIGIAAACVVLQHGSIQLVQVSRSMGPVFTALWAYLILDQSTRGRALLALALALAGTALASWREPTFSMLTFCLMLTVNTALTFRNAVTKRVLRLALPPAALPLPQHLPKPAATAPAAHGPGSGGGGAEEAARTLFQLPEVVSCVLLAATNALGLAGVMTAWAAWAAWTSRSPAQLQHSLALAMRMPDATWMLLAWLGFCSFMYNVSSQIVLAHVHVVSHGMLELFKRVFVLLAASLLLGDVQWHWHNALGAGVATAATVLYFCTVSGAGAGGARAASQHAPPPGGKDAPDAPFPDTPERRPAADGEPLCPPHGGALSDSMRKKALWPDRRSGSVCPPAGGMSCGGCGRPARRLHVAYVVMLVILALSPVQFMESMGVSVLTPAWLRAPRAGSRSGDEWDKAAAAEDRARLVSEQAMQSLSGSSGSPSAAAEPSAVLQHPTVDSQGGSEDFSPGNFLISNSKVRFSMQVKAPEPAEYLPRDLGQGAAVLRGGPYHRGLLPYHRGLVRAAGGAAGAVACAAGGDGGGGDGAALGQLPRALQSLAGSASGSAAAEGSAGGSAAAAVGLVGVYTGWLAQDNLGDEIVADLFLDLLTAAVIEATDASTCVSLDRASAALRSTGWRGCTLHNTSACDFGVIGGGSTIYVDYIKRLGGLLDARRQLMLFGSGFQSGLLPKTSNDKYLKRLCKGRLAGGVRGMYTQGHLEKYGCSSVGIVRDSALLSGLLYSGGVSALRPQLLEHSGVRHVVVATLKNDTAGVFASAIHTLLRTTRFAVVLQAVDAESARLHHAFAASMNAKRPPGSPPVLVHEEYRDWAAVLDLYRHASASVNSRLHSGVLSASVPRPTLYIATNIKYKDFMASIGQRSKLIDASRRRHVQAGPRYFGEYVAALVADAVRQAPALHKQGLTMQRDTLAKYKAAMADFLAKLEQQDPGRFRATLQCKHIHIARSSAEDKRVLVKVECLQPSER